jgi:hypothetical protein
VRGGCHTLRLLLGCRGCSRLHEVCRSHYRLSAGCTTDLQGDRCERSDCPVERPPQAGQRRQHSTAMVAARCVERSESTRLGLQCTEGAQSESPPRRTVEHDAVPDAIVQSLLEARGPSRACHTDAPASHAVSRRQMSLRPPAHRHRRFVACVRRRDGKRVRQVRHMCPVVQRIANGAEPCGRVSFRRGAAGSAWVNLADIPG